VSLKSIELQLALPKTNELGKLQNQMHQRTPLEQSQLTAQMKAQEVRKRKRTVKSEKSSLKEQNTTKTPKRSDHYLGKHIDIEL